MHLSWRGGGGGGTTLKGHYVMYHAAYSGVGNPLPSFMWENERVWYL